MQTALVSTKATVHYLTRVREDISYCQKKNKYIYIYIHIANLYKFSGFIKLH